MLSKQRPGTGRLCATVMAALVIAGCANPRPAPVVNRTNLPPGEAPPFGTAPGQPGVIGGADGSPLRGATEGGPGAGVADPNLRTAPKGIKRPYGELAAADPRVPGAYAGAGTGASAPPVVAATAPPSAMTAPVPARGAVTPPGAAPAGAPGTSGAIPQAIPQPVLPAATAALPPAAPAIPAAASGAAGSIDGVAFGWPATGGVLQNFDQTSSKGLALGGKAGDTVRAAADGKVIFSGAGPRGYGNLIIVKHDNELLSVYAHNRSLTAKEGDTVKRGQKIAELGNSGTDTPKLHFEIRQQGRPIDPLAVLPKR
jgi:lipoprotein NlpD